MSNTSRPIGTPWTRSFDVISSGIVFAAGLSLVGAALGGAAGSLLGGITGVAGGIVNEIASQKSHREHDLKKTGE